MITKHNLLEELGWVLLRGFMEVVLDQIKIYGGTSERKLGC